MRPTRQTLAVNLLLEGQKALVVGGGRVGLRKTHTLLAAGMSVRLVCPKAVPEFKDMAIEWNQKKFDPSDLDDCALVIACTDDKFVNRSVLEAAKKANILCCCADGNWAEGDFIVPATFSTNDAKISVSTNGRSCRSAKRIMESLQRFMTQQTDGCLFILGVNESIPLPLSKELLSQRLNFLSGLYEWVFLTTCHRTMFIAWATHALIESKLLHHIFNFPASYTHESEDAMRHLTYLLAGLESRMIGEFHIVGQVRDAFDHAREAGWARAALPEVYAEAYQRAQKLRNAIAPHLPNIEVEALALEGATGRVVIAGTGSLGMATAHHARKMGLDVTLLYHSRPAQDDWDCRPLNEWESAIKGASRFISACTMDTPYFVAEKIPIPMVDLGAPRNIVGDNNVRDLDALRCDYLKRTNSVNTILSIANTVYQTGDYRHV